MTLKERLAGKYRLAEHDVLPFAVRRCFPPLSGLAFSVLNMFVPSAFAHDRDVVADALNASSMAEVRQSVDLLHYRARQRAVFWRDFFGIRISGRRLMGLAAGAFSSEGRREES